MTKKKLFKQILNIVIDLVAIAVISFAVVKIVVTYSFTSYFIDGNSMTPTLKGDKSIDQGSYYGQLDESQRAIDRIERFDIVSTYYSFESSDYTQPFVSGQSKLLDSASLKIKRVIGVPGDTIFVNNDYFSISFVEGEETKKYEFSSDNCPFGRNGDKNNGNCIENRHASLTLKENEYFVMGDNWTRLGSKDCCNTNNSDCPVSAIYKENIRGVAVNIQGTCNFVSKNVCLECKTENESTSSSCSKCHSKNLKYTAEIKDKKRFAQSIGLKKVWQKYIGSLDI